MPKPLDNVFSKLALPQDLGPNPYDQEDLQGWPNAFAFLSIVNYQFGNLCPNLWSTFSRNWRCLKTWDQIHVIMRVSKCFLTHLRLFLSSIISLELYAQTFGQRFLETDDASRPGTNPMWLGGSTMVAWRICFYFYRQMSIWNFMQNLRVNVFSKLSMSQVLGPIPCH